MTLPIVSQPYPLGPLSLETDEGTYWLNGSFRASHLIPGSAMEEMTRGEDADFWERLGDGERMPEVLTLSGSLIRFSTSEGLRQDVKALRRAARTASKLVRDNGDTTTREVPLDGGEVDANPVSKFHYRATVTLYPTSSEVTAGTAAAAPTLRDRETTTGTTRVTTDGRTRVAIS